MNKVIMLLLAIIIIQLIGCNDSSESSSNDSSNTKTGTAGSMARFAVIDDYLYTIAGSKLKLFDISQPAIPNPWSHINIDFDIETLFPYNNHLLIGSRTGVHIYENSDPAFPQYVSKFVHATSCDPVVAQGDYAYVTLRSNNNCRGELNQLDVLNISDVENPTLERSYSMLNPKGLGVDGNKLFVCDGSAGLKVLDITDPKQITSIETQKFVNCYDVIAKSGLLVVSDNERILQYDYSGERLAKLSSFYTYQEPNPPN